MAAAGSLLHRAATRRVAATGIRKGGLSTGLQAPPQGGEGGAAKKRGSFAARRQERLGSQNLNEATSMLQ